MVAPSQFQHCMVFAGGGFRYGIYLGMYAAARDAGRAPDVLLASCGGAIAAATIALLSDDAQRKAWLSSPEMYEFWRSVQPSRQASLVRVLTGAGRRRLSGKCAAVIPDLFGDYLFDMHGAMPVPPPHKEGGGPAVAIVGARLLFERPDAGAVRGQRKLFEQTVFCDAPVARILNGMISPFAGPKWGNHAIAKDVCMNTVTPLDAAVAISTADCFYFKCHSHAGQYYTGGLVDLFPIEIAQKLAHTVTMEFKPPFDQHLAVPAWRAVLGLDANQRLRHVHAQPVDNWVDTSDISSALAKEQIQKRLDMRANCVRLVAPKDHASFIAHMKAQWDYGYQRCTESLNRDPASSKPAIRRVNQFNSPHNCT